MLSYKKVIAPKRISLLRIVRTTHKAYPVNSAQYPPPQAYLSAKDMRKSLTR